jgi:hypothetical protein
MADRQGAPTHDPISDLLARLTRTEQRLDAVTAAFEAVHIAPLRIVVTVRSGGPPPTYLVELVNPASGGRVTLADYL